MSEALQLTEDNLRITTPTPGVTVEFKPPISRYQEDIRGRMEIVTAGLIFAADLAMLNSDGAAKSLSQTVADIHRDLADRGLIAAASDLMPLDRFGRDGIRRMYELSARMTHGLLDPQSRDYTIGGFGTPDGGKNLLGDTAASYGFDYSSPQGSNIDDFHWYKTTLQFVDHGHGKLTTGVYAYGHQRLKEHALRTRLESPELHRFLGGDPGVRVSAMQPTVLKELKFDQSDYSDKANVPNVISINGLKEILDGYGDEGLVYRDFGSAEPSIYGAHATASLIDRITGLGYAIGLEGWRQKSDTDMVVVTSEGSGSIGIYAADGSLIDLNHIKFEASPIVAQRYRDGVRLQHLRQDENVIITPERIRAAELLNNALDNARERLLNQ